MNVSRATGDGQKPPAMFARLGLALLSSWLAKLAVVGGGPIFRKAGRFPIYTDVDLDTWAQGRISAPRCSTSASHKLQHETAQTDT